MTNLPRDIITYLTYTLITLFWGWWSVETGLTETMKYPFVYVLFFLSFLYIMKRFPIHKKDKEDLKPPPSSGRKVINKTLHKKIKDSYK